MDPPQGSIIYIIGVSEFRIGVLCFGSPPGLWAFFTEPPNQAQFRLRVEKSLRLGVGFSL